MTKKPVILITIYRRYHELAKNLEESIKLFGEFQIKPDVVVVWAKPEISRLWFFQKLLAENKIQHLISRPQLPGEEGNVATSYPESYNIRRGLNFIKSNYGDGHYCIMQCADILPKPGCYHFVDRYMQENESVLFFLEGAGVQQDIWYTNFFAVGIDDKYWPPLSNLGNQDILERQWGKDLAEKCLPNIHRWHNCGFNKFVHVHESENMEQFPIIAQKYFSEFTLSIKGYMTFWQRVKKYLSAVYYFFRRK